MAWSVKDHLISQKRAQHLSFLKEEAENSIRAEEAFGFCHILWV